MARIPVKFAEMHNPVFLLGKSFTAKLDPTQTTGLSIEYDHDTDKIYITYAGPKGSATATVPLTSVMYFIEGETPKRGPVVGTAPPLKLPALPSAQVEHPQGHVHGGPGAGKTGVLK